MEKEIKIKSKLSYNIERIDVDMKIPTRCHYIYKFTSNQWLDSIDDFTYFNMDQDKIKQSLIDNLVSEFRISLNNVIFGDPSGKEYVEYMKNEL